MYAFTAELQQSWLEFFNLLKSKEENSDTPELFFKSLETRFSTDEDTYTSDRSLIAQTCGFPYMKKWRESHSPICVPVFDIDGCRNQHYCSWFVKNKLDHRNTLDEFRGTRVVINSWESNSGMNVLRFAVSKLAKDGKFFNGVNVTGSHHKSMSAVAGGDAEMASIDAVSFYFACQTYPELVEKLEIFDQSESTVGLPFVQKRSALPAAETVISTLNTAVERYQNRTSNKLRLQHFLSVSETEYLPIIELEKQAAEVGYHTLQ